MIIVLAFNIIMPELCNVGKFTGRHIVGDENCAHLKHNHAYIMHARQVPNIAATDALHSI